MASARLVSVVLFGAGAFALGACGGGGETRPDSGMTTMTDTGMTSMVDTGVGPVDTGVPVDTGSSMGRMCGRHIPMGQCDVIAQDCPTPTDGCYYGAAMPGEDPTTICAPAGLATRGMPCTALNECQEGLFCNGATDTCTEYCCEGMVSDCSAGDICRSYSDVTWLGECQTPDSCTVVPQSGCDAGEGCYVIDSDGTLSCETAGMVAEGGDCSTGRCMPGMICINTGAGMPAQCRRACRVSMGMADCGGSAMCGGVMGLGDLGVCPLPG